MSKAHRAGVPAGSTLRVLAFAFVARLAVAAYALLHFPTHWFYLRGEETGLLADSLVHGAGLSSPFGPATGATAMIAPGYPVFVAGVFRVLGSYSSPAELILIAVNILFNVLTVWLILRMGQRLAGPRAALWSATFWACSLPLLWLPTIFWDTSASIFLLLGLTELFISLQRDAGVSTWAYRKWAISGACCGLAGLVNPALLPSLFALSIWALWTGRHRGVARKASLALLTFLMVYSSWPIRNARIFHAWIGTRTTVGIELWMGNHPGSTGFLDESMFPTFNRAEFASYKAKGELNYTNAKSESAGSYIRTHPRTFLRLTLLRTARFWTGSGNLHGSPFFVLHAVLTTLLGAVGLFYLRLSAERGVALALLLPLLLFPLPYYVTHAEFRYRLVVDPLLAVLSAKALQHLLAVDWLSGVRRRLQVTAELEPVQPA